MAEESIDRISVDISSDAGAAVRNLNNLVTALGNLEGKVGSSAAKLLQMSSSLNSLKRATVGLDVSGLRQLNEVKFSKTVPNNLSLLATALQGMPADTVATLMGVASGLQSLGTVSIPKGTVTQIAKLPAVFREFQNLNTAEFAEQLRQLNAQLAPFAANVSKLGAAWSKLPPSLRSVAAAARTVASSNKYLQTTNTALIASNTRVASSFQSIAASAKSAIGRIAGLTAAYQLFKRAFEATIGNVNTYIENMNLFEASMGKYTQSATEYGQKIQDVLGIDFADWARNQGVFQTLITGMGDTADRAAVMSQQLTQLGYDIASFYNISVEDAMLKLQSGMAGELEPLRRLGWDLSNARMQLEATKLGIEGNVQEMTQAEKVGLRYHLIMTQVTQTHGDMARTIASPANQLRVLQAQLSLTARAIGNLFIPALNMVLPLVIAVVKAVRLLAQSIADLVGLDATFEVDYSTLDTSGINMGAEGFEDAADAAEKATKKAKEYKSTVMGFDELNKLNAAPEDGSGDSGDGGKGSGVGIDLPLETYDFLAGLTDRISKATDELAGKIAALLPYIGAVGAGLAAWKIASSLGAGLSRCAGLTMSVAGAAMMVYNWLDMWSKGVGWGNLLGYLGGMALLVAGLGVAFGPVAAAAGAVVGLVGLAAAAFHDMWQNGLTWSNEVAAAISALGLSGLGATIQGIVAWLEKSLGVFKGGLGAALKTIGKVAGALGLVVSAIDLVFNAMDVWNAIRNGASISAESVFGLCTSILGIGLALTPVLGWPALAVAAVVAAVAAIAAAVYNNWDAICAFFSGLPDWFDVKVCKPVAAFFSGLWQSVTKGIGDWWSGVAQWFDANVVKPVMAVWSPIDQWFGKLWGSISATASALWHNVGVFAEGCMQLVQRAWQLASAWFEKNVAKPLGSLFDTLWGGAKYLAEFAWTAVKTVWDAASKWFDDTFAKPVRETFGGAWDSVASGASGAWEKVKQAFSNVAGFFGGVFSEAWDKVVSMMRYGGKVFDGVVDAVLGAFKWGVNGLIDGINWAVAQPFNGLNGIIGSLRDWEALGIRPFSGFVDVPVPQIPRLAEGRYGIDAGQLFVARERGAEMVGSMGGHTTVANNQQIVEGIEAGVMRAMVRAMSMQAGSGEAVIEIPLVIGNEEVARAVWRGEASMIRRGKLKPQFV